ncbi:MAG: FAD-dependent oxidoreductase [Candidatus Bathyarchaeota archaeon]|nr:FAD-dependent oxidoreductase [Candidatus Bathyarchaeum tardum]
MITVAVVGAGVGGCSAAYFARKYIPGSNVTIYEAKSRVGGRAFTYHQEQIQNELGAEFFNSSNIIVSGLVTELGLQTKKLNDLIDIAVWNGNEIIFQSGQSLFYKMLGLVNNYKFSVPKLLFSLKLSERNIKNLYKQQEKSPAEFWKLFESVGLDKWYKSSFEKILLDKGVDTSFIDELITPITRIIYSQNASLGGFAGLVALLGVYSQDLYNLKDGNQALPKKLLEASNSKVELETKVKVVEKLSDGTFLVYAGEKVSVFDAVIVAAPLEVANISFDGVTIQNQLREYQTIYVRLMKGQINPGYFNLSSSKLPSIVLTSQEADPFTRFSINQSTKKGESWVTVTSTKPLEDSFVDELFKKGATVFDHTWCAAYPVFEPIQKLPNMCLDDNLLYLNGIESAASSMETSTFAALNSVKAIMEQLG